MDVAIASYVATTTIATTTSAITIVAMMSVARSAVFSVPLLLRMLYLYRYIMIAVPILQEAEAA